MFSYILKSIIPIIILIIVVYGMIKGKKVYEWFVEGAKEGLGVCFRIFPYLLAMLIAVKVFRESGALNIFTKGVSPITKLIGLPSELLPLVIIKPLSGSGALGVFTEILKEYGPDSIIGLIASIIMGTTETIFYTLTVYYGSVGIKKIRHTLWAALLADFTAILASITIVRLFFIR
ncbi:spore maturation protein B [Clostridium amylolyticum]|uniref:Spore maturation protein B n=1 Tax=Clostridium amylolyticum TaxID=1121298 RepID=A0A1M6EIL7_9CLOT|nr:spore maturation protein [Clostridium amylolyticum]SHI85322.1 spore maturation protein B [Clostridium amylolyticum]